MPNKISVVEGKSETMRTPPAYEDISYTVGIKAANAGLPPENRFVRAIIGGTGKYSGARGEVVVRPISTTEFKYSFFFVNEETTTTTHPTEVAGPHDPATVATESTSPGLCGCLRPPQPATRISPQAVAPVLRFPCSVGSVCGLDLYPGRFRFHSHPAPPFSSPHAMWVKFGGHPKKIGATHESATPRRYVNSKRLEIRAGCL